MKAVLKICLMAGVALAQNAAQASWGWDDPELVGGVYTTCGRWAIKRSDVRQAFQEDPVQLCQDFQKDLIFGQNSHLNPQVFELALQLNKLGYTKPVKELHHLAMDLANEKTSAMGRLQALLKPGQNLKTAAKLLVDSVREADNLQMSALETKSRGSEPDGSK